MKTTALHKLGVLTGIFTLAACTGDPGPTDPNVGHVLASQAVKDDIIPGSYIVVLKSDSTPSRTKTRTVTDRLVSEFGGKVTFRYDVALHGYAKYVSGTSFSAPYVAGVVATMLQKDPTLVPSGIVSAIQANATIGAVSGVPSGTPNVLLFSNFL